MRVAPVYLAECNSSCPYHYWIDSVGYCSTTNRQINVAMEFPIWCPLE